MRGQPIVQALIAVAVVAIAGTALWRPDRPRYDAIRADEWGRRLTSTDRAVADDAFRTLRDAKRDAMPVVFWLVRYEDASVRRKGLALATALGSDGAEALPHLLRNLSRGETDDLARAETLRALGAIGSAGGAVVSALVTALNDDVPEVKVAAARALARLGEAARPARDALRRHVDDDREAAPPDGARVRIGDEVRRALAALD